MPDQPHATFLDSLSSEARARWTHLADLDPRPYSCLADALAHSASPATTLVRLERYLDAHVSRDQDLLRIADEPRYAQLLCAILGQSHALTDLLCRRPESAWDLWSHGTLNKTRSSGAMRDELQALLEGAPAPSEYPRILREYKQREMLRIAARDVFVHASVASVTEDLSNLADASLEAALWCVRQTLEPRFGAPLEEQGGAAAFSILAFGKLGGRELNFCSDIDITFIYSQEGRTTGGRSGAIANAEYFHRLGEQIIKLISERTAEGNVFNVDMRLRPHGRGGALAVSLETALTYYAETGRAWERQALIKARPAAGNLVLGQRFINETRPFVYPRYFDDDMLEDIRETKAEMEALIARRGQSNTEVKLGLGGIRDIEFTVQMLQLLLGGRVPTLRTPNTLDAIRALGEREALTLFQSQTLANNYNFLRRVEHRLQIDGGQQRHALPE